jgi:UDP-N-acetylglucosamine 1-carboxyvinyltransferase
MGAMLGRFGEAFLPTSGGCDFGVRPIDQHLLGFGCLGALAEEGAQGVHLQAGRGLRGACIRLAMPSVGATANLMMAASLARGETVIENAAAEPHVAALADFLRAAGARISGLGTDRIVVCGVDALHGVCHRIISDMIEAGTYLCFGAACGGRVSVSSVRPGELGALLAAFTDMGIDVFCGADSITVSAPNGYRCTDVVTAPYPGFPTDLHPQLVALMAVGGRAAGRGSVRETVFSSRFRYVRELCRIGADVRISDAAATVMGGEVRAARVVAPDLRGGAALLLAALTAKGKSEILGAAAIGRGYEHLEQKLRALGADVTVF